jgi:hypothetical protein
MNNIKSWAETNNLVEKYAEFVMDSMDMKTMEQFVFDTLYECYSTYDDDQLISEITEAYGEEWFADNDIELPPSQDS